jgi:hypothetical protein
LCLALVLQTNYRLAGGVGIGEIGLAAVILLAILLREPASTTGQTTRERFSRGFLIYLVTCLLPSTILTARGTWGTSIDPAAAWRDYFAYVLSGLVIWVMAARRFDIASCAKAFAVCTLAITLFQYRFGGSEAWYGLRFTGGAKNPNQLALYCLCGMAATAAHIRHPRYRLPLLTGFAAMGFACRSDAFMLTLMMITAVFAMAVLFPARYLWIGVFTLGALVLYVAAFSTALPEALGNRWGDADQGGTRLTLLRNGLTAWQQSWWTILFGNGGGAFSGKIGPFEGDEAHNTIVDTLAIGGVVGVVALFWYPVQTTWDAYGRGKPLLFATMMGVLAFACFHYVGRHPVFWFTVLAVGAAAEQRAPVAIRPRRARPAGVPLSPARGHLGAC